MTKRWQFEEISVHAGNLIDTVGQIKNIADNNDNTNYLFLANQAGDLVVNRSTSFDADDSSEIFVLGRASVTATKMIRRWGNDFIAAQLENTVGGPDLFRFSSNDDGDTWSVLRLDISIDGADVAILVDTIRVGATNYYLYSLNDDSAGTIKVFSVTFAGVSVTGNDIKDENSVFPGFINGDGDYQYMEFGSDDKWYDVVFDGTSFTRIELTDADLTPPNVWDTSRQLYWDIRDRHIILTGNQMYQKLKGIWTLTSVAAEQDVVGVIWRKNDLDEYTFDYVTWNDQLYYFTPPGNIIKIQPLSVDARVGHDDWFSTGSAIHQRTNSPIVIDKGFISKEKMGFRILTFESFETSFIQGDGIVFVEDDGTEIFIGNIASVSTILGTQAQLIIAFSPEKDDLEKEINENFGTVDEEAILDILYANHFEFYYKGTIDDTGNTQTLPSSIRNAHGILKDLEPFGARVVYNELDGKQFYDEADEVALNVKRNTKTEPGVDDWGESGDPDGWTVSEPADTFVEVVSEFEGHTFPVQIFDGSNVNAASMTKTFSSVQTSGTFDFWFSLTEEENLNRLSMNLLDGANITILITIFNGIVNATDGDGVGGGSQENVGSWTANTWHHISIVFDCATDLYDLYYDGVLVANDFGFRTNAVNVNKLQFITRGSFTTSYSAYIDSVGFSWEDYTQFSNFKIVLTDANSQIVPNGLTLRGQDINAVVVKGGVDDNLPTDQEVPVGIARVPGVSQQQLKPAIYNIPSLKTQAEVDARAALILASGPTALIVYQIQYFGDGVNRPAIPQIGRTVDLTNAEHSLTNEILIVQSWRYNLDNNSIIFFATNGLFFLTNNETRDVMNINTERIFQLARIVALRTVPGLTFYLDNTASDIGGYKKMLDIYAGDAKVTFTNTNAIDGEAIEEFATEPNVPGITLLDDGEYNLHFHAQNTQVGSKQARIFFELYKRTIAPAETLIATSESTSLLVLAEAEYNIHAHVSAIELVATDRLIVKLIISVAGSGAAPDVLTFIQGTGGDVTSARFEMPSSSQVIANKVDKKGDTMTGPLNVIADITAEDGNSLIAKSDGNDKNVTILHDDSVGKINSSSGDLELSASVGNVKINDVLATLGIITNLNKVNDIGTAAVAYNDMYADDFNNVASEKKYTVPSDDEVYQELKEGSEPYIKEILIKEWTEKETIKREEVPLDYIAKENEILETHHKRAMGYNLDYLNAIIRKLINKIEDLEKLIGV